MQLIRRIALLAALSGLAGCGSGLHSVTGKVVFKDGSPYTAGGQIIFEAFDPPSKVSSRGNLQEDGTFRMGTYQDTDGVPDGKYKIAVVPTPPPNFKRPPPGYPPFHKRFNQTATSKLEWTVPNANKELVIVVEK